jgi:hypothetical protein
MDAEVLSGSCLCGAVTYEVRGPFMRFVHCHCTRCRKATGTGHATNLLAALHQFRWQTGQELAVRYDLPTAASFATTFCSRCGSPLPHATRSGKAIVVPAGSLDTHPSVTPETRIFWASRAPWSCADEMPRMDEYTPL